MGRGDLGEIEELLEVLELRGVVEAVELLEVLEVLEVLVGVGEGLSDMVSGFPGGALVGIAWGTVLVSGVEPLAVGGVVEVGEGEGGDVSEGVPIAGVVEDEESEEESGESFRLDPPDLLPLCGGLVEGAVGEDAAVSGIEAEAEDVVEEAAGGVAVGGSVLGAMDAEEEPGGLEVVAIVDESLGAAGVV